MDANEFRIRGKETIDFIADYLENIKERRVTPEVEPGFLSDILPNEAPQQGELWPEIFQDFESKIMPGITHWQHPRFHSYFPAGNSYPSIIGELLSAGLGTVGFSWAACPSATELEIIVLNWLGKMLNLPKMFLPYSEKEKQDETFKNIEEEHFTEDCADEGSDEVLLDSMSAVDQVVGGGVILGSASECVLVALLSARSDILRRLKAKHPFVEDGVLLSKLIMYTSKLAHSCVEKAAMIAMVKIRLLETDDKFSMRGIIVEKQMKEDRSNGLIPFFVSCTFGTTSCCSFDNISEIGTLCTREDIYLHVDGAYAGSSLICPEFRPLVNGLELVNSFNFNPNKWMLINFDCSCLWVKNSFMLTKALSVDPIYLRYKEMDKAIDYRHWGIALSRRFRSLKIWFTLRSYGIEGIQKYIREHVRLAKVFESYVLSDSRFEILGKVVMGLVCFRLKGANSLSQELLFNLNDEGSIHMVPAMLDDKYVIRFCVNAQNANDADMKKAWELIKKEADNQQYIFPASPIGLQKPTFDFNKKYEKQLVEEEEVDDETASRLKRLRFRISRMVSDPEFVGTKNHTSPKNQFKRTNTFRFNKNSSTGALNKQKYLARKCSQIEDENKD